MRRFRTFGETKKRGGIPADCVEVEWLKIPGAAYIDLDYYTGNKLRIVLKASFPSGTGEQDIIGNQDNATGRFVLGTSGGKWFSYSRSASKSDANAWSGSYAVGDICEVETVYDTANNVKTLSVNGTAATATSCTTVANTNKPVRIFRGTSGSLTFMGELYSLYMEKDGVPWYDFVPVRRVENGVSVGYLCNRITGELHAGTGAFVIGPDKYDSEVEYLESVEVLKAGSQITFPVGARATFECKLHIFDTRDLKFMGLMYNEGGAYQGCFQISTMSGGYRTQAPFMGVLSVDTPPVDITRPIVYKSPDPNHLYWTIDGVQYPVGACRWNTAGNFHLFHAGVLNYANDKGRNRLYWCKVYEDGVLTYDFIPVRYRGVGYLYDKVSGRLFGNQGSGEFVIGADVKHAKDYVQDGLVAMWDGIENAGWGVHDDAATAWKDLVGGNQLSLDGRIVGKDYIPVRNGDELSRVKIDDFTTIYQSGEYTQEVAFRVNKSVASVSASFLMTCGYGFIGKYTNASDKTNFFARVYNWQSYYSDTELPSSHTVTMQLRDDGTYRWIDGVDRGSAPTIKATHVTGYHYVDLPKVTSDFSVDIYCVRLYHKNLTPAEIAANYAIDKARFGI